MQLSQHLTAQGNVCPAEEGEGGFCPPKPRRYWGSSTLAARGESPALHRERRGARLARRDDREYREYLREEQRSQAGCIAVRMQSDFHHGLPGQTPEEAGG